MPRLSLSLLHNEISVKTVLGNIRDHSLKIRDDSCLGSILIVSLWAFGVLSILSLAIAGFVFQQIKFTNFYIRQTISLPLARGACQRTFEERKQEETPDYDTLAELKEVREETLCDNIAYKYYFVDKKIIDGKEKIIDESALININTVSSDILKRLPGLDEDLAREIVNSSRRPFKLKEELLLIEGMDKDKFNKFKDLITTLGSGKININTAEDDVLSALGLEDDLIQLIMRYRQEYIGIDGKPDTEDDGAFTNAANTLSDLRRFTSLTLEQEQDLLSAMNMLDVKSQYLRLNVIPQIKGREGVHYSIAIHPQTNKIISWSEK